MTHNVFRDGKVHVLSEKCATCIFRPGNKMHLSAGRVKGMVDEAIRDESVIVCHSTLQRDDVGNAACRGFTDSYGDRVQAIQVADRLGLIEYQQPPSKGIS